MNKVPNLRFQGFNEDWKKQKLGKLTKLTDGVHFTPTYVESGVPFWSVETVVSNVKPKYITQEAHNEAIKRCYPQYGDILLTRIGTLARPKLVDWNEPFSIYVSLALIKSSSKFNSKFCKYYLETEYYRKDFLSKSLLTATPQKINMEDLKHTKLSLPSQKEQEKIASFFSLIDKKIELQTEKVEELKNYKKGIMQKIFSQELRFKDENGNEYPEWEEKKLGNFIVEYKEKTTVENEYPVLTSSRSGLMFQTDYFKDRQVTTQDNIGYHIIPRGYITFRSRSDDTTFKFNQNNLIDKGIISYFYPVFCFNESLNDMYALYFMNNYLGCQIRREIVGTSQLVLSLNKLKELKIPVPCIEEQNKIGKLLDNLENKILQEQNKLNHFNRYKKGLLQQMFI